MKVKLLAALLGSFLLITGCTSGKNDAVDKLKEETHIEQSAEQEETSADIKQNEDLTMKIQDEEGVIDGQVASDPPSQSEIADPIDSGLNLKFNRDTKQVSLLDISLFDSEEKVIQLFGEPEEITEIAPGEYYYNYNLEDLHSGDLLVGFYEDRVDFLGYESILGSYLEINKSFFDNFEGVVYQGTRELNDEYNTWEDFYFYVPQQNLGIALVISPCGGGCFNNTIKVGLSNPTIHDNPSYYTKVSALEAWEKIQW